MGESAIQVGVTLAASDPVVGDAEINNQVTLSRRVLEVVDDFEVPALEARALGDALRLDSVSSSLEEGAELTNHPKSNSKLRAGVRLLCRRSWYTVIYQYSYPKK